MAETNCIDLKDAGIIDIYSKEQEGLKNRYADLLFKKRQRKGMTMEEAREKSRIPIISGL